MNRILIILAASALLFLAACGGKETVASKSAEAYREAQAKGTPPGGGDAHAEHPSGGAATDPHAGHVMPAAEAAAPQAPDAHEGHGTMAAEGDPHAQHRSGGAAPDPHAGHVMPAAGAAAAPQATGAHAQHGTTSRASAGDPHAQHGTASRANASDPHAQHGTASRASASDPHAQHRAGGAAPASGVGARDPHAGHTMTAAGAAAAPQATAARDPHAGHTMTAAGAAAAPQPTGAHAQHGMTSRATSSATTKTPGAILQPDEFDAPSPVSVQEAQRAAGGGAATTGQPSHEGHGDTAGLYVCPMHPEVTSATPANCPRCGMALVKKEK